MARKLNNTITLQNVQSKLQQEDLPSQLLISDLIEHKDNEYLFGGNDVESIQNLVEGIRKDGFKGAILVWDMLNGKYMIFSGHRRKRAMEALGRTKIPCFIYKYPEEEPERRRLLLGSNIYTRGSIDAAVRHIYIARQIRYLRETLKMEGFTGNYKKRLAEEFGTSESKIQRYEALLNCSDRILEAEDQGIIPMAQASSLSVLSMEEQDKILDAVLKLNRSGSLSRTEIQNIINMVKFREASPEDTEAFIREHEEQVRGTNAASLVNEILGKANHKTDKEETQKEERETGSAEKNKKTPYQLYSENLQALSVKLRKAPPQDKEERKELIEQLQGLIEILSF